MTNEELAITLYNIFKSFGPIASVKASRDQRGRPFGFVEYSDGPSTLAALSIAPILTIDNRKVRVEIAKRQRKICVKYRMPTVADDGKAHPHQAPVALEDALGNMQRALEERVKADNFKLSIQGGWDQQGGEPQPPARSQKGGEASFLHGERNGGGARLQGPGGPQTIIAAIVRFDDSEEAREAFSWWRQRHPEWEVTWVNMDRSAMGSNIRNSGLVQLVPPTYAAECGGIISPFVARSPHSPGCNGATSAAAAEDTTMALRDPAPKGTTNGGLYSHLQGASGLYQVATALYGMPCGALCSPAPVASHMGQLALGVGTRLSTASNGFHQAHDGNGLHQADDGIGLPAACRTTALAGTMAFSQAAGLESLCLSPFQPPPLPLSASPFEEEHFGGSDAAEDQENDSDRQRATEAPWYGCTLYVGRLNGQQVTIASLKDRFSAYGTIAYIRLYNRGLVAFDGVPLDGHAFIRYGSASAVQQAIVKENSTVWLGQTIKCEQARQTVVASLAALPNGAGAKGPAGTKAPYGNGMPNRVLNGHASLKGKDAINGKDASNDKDTTNGKDIVNGNGTINGNGIINGTANGTTAEDSKHPPLLGAANGLSGLITMHSSLAASKGISNWRQKTRE